MDKPSGKEIVKKKQTEVKTPVSFDDQVRSLVEEHARTGRVTLPDNEIGARAREIIRGDEPFALYSVPDRRMTPQPHLALVS